MFSNTEAFALLYLLREVDEQKRAVHARSVVRELGLDRRLESLVPPRPARGRRRRDYEAVIAAFREWSALPEPERTRVLEEFLHTVGAQGT